MIGFHSKTIYNNALCGSFLKTEHFVKAPPRREKGGKEKNVTYRVDLNVFSVVLQSLNPTSYGQALLLLFVGLEASFLFDKIDEE
ncbi:hypothetical protein T02_3406 [Trichinella nativa]|uniref:Uncharacterized protein n=1 Tax=Trichinella nativa TaxID=6335 RepID=A0A0V1LL31_9BILA|nr:hypothetical protein T09_12156 [Trichinella sp. T9]KRZ60076.1 hypothetical protein T02_3406 [Trichinella nativa]